MLRCIPALADAASPARNLIQFFLADFPLFDLRKIRLLLLFHLDFLLVCKVDAACSDAIYHRLNS
jgi:hypothetical protein